MTASARPHLQLIPDRLEATGVGDNADDRCLPDGAGGQLRQNRFRVLLAGDTKRDKSTLLNVLLGRDVLPTGLAPVTALATTVRGGEADLLDPADLPEATPQATAVVAQDGGSPVARNFPGR